jgi:hypothetical protein
MPEKTIKRRLTEAGARELADALQRAVHLINLRRIYRM